MQTRVELIRTAQAYYPERLGLAVVCNPPFLFWALWRSVSPFLDPVTKCASGPSVGSLMSSMDMVVGCCHPTHLKAPGGKEKAHACSLHPPASSSYLTVYSGLSANVI